MRIRTLVPALACLAAAQLITAAETGPAIKFDGFVDSIYSVSSNEHGGSNTGFSYDAKLGVAATISEKVSAQVDLNIYDNQDDSEGDNNWWYSRQMYGTWKINSDVELKTGKFISDYGWTAAYSPGLYRINSGPIVALYGVDQVGANVKTTQGDFTVALTVANGFFQEGYGTGGQDNNASVRNADNEAYAWGLDVVYSLGDMGSVNLELIADQDVGDDGVAGAESGGDGYQMGLNTTLTPSKELTVAAELILTSVNNKGGCDNSSATGAMILANYELATAMPMSVTAQFTYLDQDTDPVIDADTVTTETALALLTNPAGTDKLGANLEINYTSTETNSSDTEYSLGFSAELLYVF